MALVTAAEVRLHLPGLSGTGEDTSLDTIIGRVGALIATHLGYPPASTGADPTAESASYTLYTDRGLHPIVIHGEDLILPVRPVTAVSAVYNDALRNYSTAVDSGDYDVLGDEGRIRLTPDRSEGSWLTATAAVKVECTAGYTTVPAWLKQAAILWVKHVWDLRRQQGRTSVSQQGTSVSLDPGTMPEVVREILAPHVVHLWTIA